MTSMIDTWWCCARQSVDVPAIYSTKDKMDQKPGCHNCPSLLNRKSHYIIYQVSYFPSSTRLPLFAASAPNLSVTHFFVWEAPKCLLLHRTQQTRPRLKKVGDFCDRGSENRAIQQNNSFALNQLESIHNSNSLLVGRRLKAK